MAGLIKLTVYADTVWIHPDAVMMVEPRYGTAGVQGTLITLRNGVRVGVQESVETVVGRIEGTRKVKACYDEDDQICYAVGYENLGRDALEQLEEREPVKPIDETCWDHTYGRCGHCRAPLPALEGLHSKFCWMCGKAVKWE